MAGKGKRPTSTSLKRAEAIPSEKPQQHDLHNFMRQITNEMAAEYSRIQARATEDPGTAGDQGEENWAGLLREWLPQSFQIVTKGRIISQSGETSPQIDVIVLDGSYPKKLLDKKLYLAAGVAAAFECKVTLKASHIEVAVKTCSRIKGLYRQRTGIPYFEVHSPIIFGLLAHSHEWARGTLSPLRKGRMRPEDKIAAKLIQADANHVTHPRLQLDLLCVADLATWTSFTNRPSGPADMSVTTSYLGHGRVNTQQDDQFTPVGVLIASLTRKLAWEYPALRNLADYYRLSNLVTPGAGFGRSWPSPIFSQETLARIDAGLQSQSVWDGWSHFLS